MLEIELRFCDYQTSAILCSFRRILTGTLQRVKLYTTLWGLKRCHFYFYDNTCKFHPNLGGIISVAPDRPCCGQQAHTAIKLFGRETDNMQSHNRALSSIAR